MKVILAILVTLVTTLAASGCAAKEPQRLDRPVAVRIEVYKSICGATQIAPHVLLSASHCFRHARRGINIDGVLGRIERIVQDNNDHALVLLSNFWFGETATFGPPAVEGDNIHYWGNPSGLPMLYRRGYVAGSEGFRVYYDANGFKGDSGSGIFNEKNELVAVMSCQVTVEVFEMMCSFPLNFTSEQLAMVGMVPQPYLMTGLKADLSRLKYSD